ncbi:MAG: hypothetical protein KatS3mg070_0713 [Meiothermus sp.]|uniref:hypothetical protein n=1 Tax=Meiothermus sp. TaxID=1955249 RepID=UPI0021DDB5EF|nr:hypothetical protein [Meiothermus sp.]GIW27350.1 MAG: hypothetical protein KatS3mg070_0713 [Meiothermus sp.]
MNHDRIEALLERIALALEQMVAQTSQHRTANVSYPQSHSDTEKTSLEPSSRNSNASSLSILEPFLNARGIQIKVRPPEDAADQVIDSLSLFLGERYEALAGLLSKIKRAMQTGAQITESLKDRPQQDISSACQFCTRLYEVAFLEQYQYFRSPTYLIKAKTTTLPKAQRFFGGQWLERFILQKVKAVYAQVSSEVSGKLAFEYLINPQIILPNGDDFELDILAAMGSSIYWIEAKSGDYQQHVAKYSKFARLLGLDPDHSFMVLADVPDDRCEALSALFSMTVCTLRSFEERLLAIVRSDTAQQSALADRFSSVSEH